jgi:7,8-dihydropterin-6-yl-methyl-4-(beta-D-ribofuranosyl)aminobenzene 5'-phosphate synthase
MPSVDALIISHGHYDHVDGRLGFLEAYPPCMRKELRLYIGGENNFCNRFNHTRMAAFRFSAVRWTGKSWQR